MSKIEDGGPAFPVPDEGQGWGAAGMTLRDWFAGQALVGLLASNQWTNSLQGIEGHLSRKSLVWADAMIAARKGEG